MSNLDTETYQGIVNTARQMLAAGSTDKEIITACRIPAGYFRNLRDRFLSEGGVRGAPKSEVTDRDPLGPAKDALGLESDAELMARIDKILGRFNPKTVAMDVMTNSRQYPEALKQDLTEAVVSAKAAKGKQATGTVPIEDDKARIDANYWKTEYFAQKAKTDKLLHSDVALDRVCDVLRELAPKSYETAPYAGITRRAGDATSPQTAVLLLSDTHVGKTTYPDQTLGFGKYDIQTYLDRLQLLEDSVGSILTDHVNCGIRELHVIMLGDMVDGNLPHGNEADQMCSLQTQWNVSAHSLAQFLRNLKRLFPKVTVTPVAGNHGRWASQRRVPTKFKNSSLDGVVYDLTAALTKDVQGLEWQIDKQPSKLFTIENSLFFASHGDHLRGGDRALGIPSHALSRQVNAICQKLATRDAATPNYYCFGHFHREMTLPHGNGKIFVNGGFPGQDEYSMAENFVGSPAEQKLLLVHPRYGMTANWPVYLEHAVEGSSRYRMEGIV